MQESITYAQMMLEVETILQHISSETNDLDNMVKNVEAAHQLINAMRQKLQQTEVKILDLQTQSLTPTDSQS